MANNSNGTSLFFKWLPITAVIALVGTGFITWGRTAEKVQNNKEKIEAIDKRVINEFDKIRREQRDWRKRDAADRKRYDATLQGVQTYLNSLPKPK